MVYHRDVGGLVQFLRTLLLGVSVWLDCLLVCKLNSTSIFFFSANLEQSESFSRYALTKVKRLVRPIVFSFCFWIPCRPYPKPALTGGVAHKAHDNQYCLRDPRREVMPSKDIAVPSSSNLLSASSSSQASAQGGRLPPTPGRSYAWD